MDNGKLNNLALLLGIILVAIMLNGCAAPSYWPEVHGRVLDETTDQPIEGAIVVAKWRGYSSHAFIQVRSTCYHIETATTDKMGRFTFPSRMDGISTVQRRFVAYRVYKAGYVTSDKTYEKEIYEKKLKYLKPFNGTNEERLKYLVQFGDVIRCANADDADKKLVIVKEKLYNEGRFLPDTKKGLEYADTLLFGFESRKYGREEAHKRRDKRLRKGYGIY
ncbi:MAG: carboxypeptidase-like regulatory domain-containing protein [Gammaproteobacteria bacterium]|nr:carboxypeptidase-like regulatory domain-containing protein [Gammaproteobacteria bacterium]